MDTSSFTRHLILTIALVLACPLLAAAQPVPNTGQIAVAGEVGLFFPADEQLDAGIVGGGLIEFYVSPRLGIRGTVTAIRSCYDRDGDNEEPNDTNFGGQALGGAEIFLNRAWTVKLEGRYQWVEDRPNLDPDGFSTTIGIKRYF